MSFPTKLLAPGEQVYVDARPNWSLLFWPIVLAVAAVAVAVFVSIAWSSAPVGVGWALLALVAVAVLYLLARVVTWSVASLVVTNQRIVYRTGLVHREGREIPISRVQDVTYRQNLIERIVGAGRLTVESAGRSGQEPFPDIRHPAAVQSLINRLATEASRPSAAPPPPPPPAAPAASMATPVEPTPAVAATPPERTIAQQLEDLAELHDHGVVTDAEYEAKRAELLGRL